MSQLTGISLVVPVFNERLSVQALINTINAQTRPPDEVIFVDGGSVDDTPALLQSLTAPDKRYRVIRAVRAMPGKGRNIGAAAAAHEWIAFTDAGIILDKDWLKELETMALTDPATDVVYGDFAPRIRNRFEKCAAITYVPGQSPGKIRGRSIASCLVRKTVWEKTGGFPDWRAAEDLAFMEKVDKAGSCCREAPAAKVYWELRPDTGSTYRKFRLYSMYNVWAGRQADWHYGILRQYLLAIVFFLLAVFHHWGWIVLIPAWYAARVAKRVVLHKNEFGLKPLFDPRDFFTILLLTLVIDMATFSGWIKALIKKPAGNVISAD
ncbi:MAG: glycosyltransferase [Sphingobacteriales bacterium]|nr:glycosyltransferase [Sphingobacteriales bacterium]